MPRRSDDGLAFGVALLLHVGVIALFSLNLSPEERPKPVSPPPAIQITAVSAETVDVQLDTLRERTRQEQQRREEAQRQVEEQRQAAIEAKRKAEAERKAAEVQRKAEAEARALEAKRKVDEERKEAERKAAEEAKRKEEERKSAEEAKRKEEQRKSAEAKRKEEERKAIEAKRKEEQRLAEQEEQRRISEMRAKMAAEEQARQAAEAATKQREYDRRMQRALAVYLADLTNRITGNWLRPPGFEKSIRCQVVVRQSTNGSVLSVNADECSRLGGDAFARSVEAAVRKSSPLPLPDETDLFDPEIAITFTTD